MNYNEVKTYIDTYIATNGVGAITGAILNEVLVPYIYNNALNLTFDVTRPYKEGQVVYYNDGTFGDMYVSNTDVSAGAWNATDWDRVTLRKQSITQTIDDGVNVIPHTLGVAPIIIMAFDSSGRVIPFDIEAVTDTNITIFSIGAYSGSTINLIG